MILPFFSYASWIDLGSKGFSVCSYDTKFLVRFSAALELEYAVFENDCIILLKLSLVPLALEFCCPGFVALRG